MLGISLSSHLSETLPVKEIEMIELSSWEWFLLLFIVMVIIWLLILFQVGSVRSENDQVQSHGGRDLNTHE